MKPGIYLEEALKDVLRTSNFTYGAINLLTAPCGSGKTTAAINVISRLASTPRKALFLIDTRNGNERLARLDALSRPYEFYRESLEHHHFCAGDFAENKIIVTTYAQFGVWAHDNPRFSSYFDVIICDEIHNLYRFPNFSRKKKENEKEPRINYAAEARDAICDAAVRGDTLIVGMTATPEDVFKLHCRIYEFPIDQSCLRQYKNKEVHKYANLRQLLQKIPRGQRGALYVKHVHQMIEMAQIASAAGHHPICVWSTTYQKIPMNEEQFAAREYILTHEEVPPQYDLFIFNASSETSINLFGRMDYMIIHTTNATTITQARGRYRDDLDLLYVLDKEEGEIVVPDQFLDVELFREDKKELQTTLSLKKDNGDMVSYKDLFMRVEQCGYTIEYGRKNYRRYLIIRQETE